jgi:serine/threonine protein kinase
MSNPIFIQKLRQELRVTKSLNHPNLVNLVDLKRTKHNLYMILDFINGDNLEVFLDKFFSGYKRSPSMNIIKHLTIEIVSGLNYLGKNNIIHRDIKLENIMLDFEEDRRKSKVLLLLLPSHFPQSQLTQIKKKIYLLRTRTRTSLRRASRRPATRRATRTSTSRSTRSS